MFVSETNFLCHPLSHSSHPRIEPQNKVEPNREKKSNQSHSREQNNTERLKIIVVQQKQSKKFAFCLCVVFWQPRSFAAKKLCHRKCIWKFFSVIAWVCLWISPHFPFCWKNLFATPSFVVCGSRNVYNHLKYITGSINVTMPTAHIFAIFHHNFLLLLYARRQFFAVHNFLLVVVVDETWKNSIQQFLKIEK